MRLSGNHVIPSQAGSAGSKPLYCSKRDDGKRGQPEGVAFDDERPEIDAATGALGRFGPDGVFARGTLPQNHVTPPKGARVVGL